MSYIGNSPGNASQRVVTRKVATAGQTRFASDSGYATGYVDVIVNGSDLVAGVDFNETGDGINIDLVEPCAADDNVKIVAYIPRGLSDGYTKPEANALLALKADLIAGKIPSSQLPAYVDDVLEYANLAAFPATGSAGIIYVAQDTNNCYRWSGSAYIVLTDLSSYYTKTQADAKFVGKDSATGAAQLPSGTTAQRPATPAVGMARNNTTFGSLEIYNGTQWVSYQPGYSVDSLIVAGGGGSAAQADSNNRAGGGGGAGGMLYSSLTLFSGTSYVVTVGAGGSGASAGYYSVGTSGGNSSLSTTTAYGGGYGGSGSGVAGASGGSGGGGGAGSSPTYGGAGTSGQGYAGGWGGNTSGINGASGGGGGGAGGVGADAVLTLNGKANGGPGVSNSISGSAVVYASGGYSQTGINEAGAANRGAGGSGNTTVGSAGGSGIVIIRYAGSQRGTGGTVTSVGGYTIHTFTSSGTFTA